MWLIVSGIGTATCCYCSSNLFPEEYFRTKTPSELLCGALKCRKNRTRVVCEKHSRAVFLILRNNRKSRTGKLTTINFAGSRSGRHATGQNEMQLAENY